MRQDFVDYAKSLGMGDALLATVSDLHEQASALLDPAIENMQEMFISEVMNGTRQYLSLYFFSDCNVIEIERFVGDPRFWKARSIPVWCSFSGKHAFDFRTASNDSRLYAEVRWADGSRLELRASGNNCLQLVKVIKRWLFRPQ